MELKKVSLLTSASEITSTSLMESTKLCAMPKLKSEKKGNITITKEIGTCNHFMMIVRGFWRQNSSAQIDRILQSNRENHEHQKIFLEYIVMQKIRPIRHEKLNLQPRTYILIHCGFVASSCVLIFAAIGCNTINILEIFQVFMVLPV